MLSAVLGSEFTFSLRNLENCSKCGVYSNKMGLSLHPKEKVGSTDQKTVMKKQACVQGAVCPFLSWETALSLLTYRKFSSTGPGARPWNATVFWLLLPLRNTTDLGWGRARSIILKSGRVRNP